jgi:hypothetical protein
MNLGERCDEIVRLIDETLADLEVDADGAPTAAGAPVAGVTPLPPRGRRGPGRPRVSEAAPRPDRAAAGF